MVIVAFLAILLSALSAQVGSITITERTGSTQTDRPFSLARYFKEGDIANYPKPRVGGTAATIWQADVKTRWPGGSVQFAIVSLKSTVSASSTITVDFVNDSNPCSSGNQAACDSAALTELQMLDFDAGGGVGSWGARIRAVQGATTHDFTARTILDGAFFTYWLRGPVVSQVIVEDKTTARTYDLGFQCSTGCTGDYNSSTWVNDTGNKSLHPIFILTFYPGWAGVKIDYVLENIWAADRQDQRFDLTLSSGTASATTKLTQSGMIHYANQRLRWTYWDGTAPGLVKTDRNLAYFKSSKAILNYNSALSLSSSVAGVNSRWSASDQGRLVTVSTVNTSGTTVTRVSGDNFSPEWGDGNDGGAVGRVYINGVAYNISSATSTVITLTTTAGTQSSVSLRHYGSHGMWESRQPNTGNREDIGPFNEWAVILFHDWDETLEANMLAMADISGKTPVHERTTGQTELFCALSARCTSGGHGSTLAYGKVFSVDAFPTGSVGSTVTPGTREDGHNWAVDLAHWPEMNYYAYLITGDYFQYEELQMQAAWALGTGTSGSDKPWKRHDDWGYQACLNIQLRGTAWSLRTISMAALMSVDATAEKLYFQQKLDYNLAIWEGKHAITNGAYNATAAWTWGNGQGSHVQDITSSANVPNTLQISCADTSASHDNVTGNAAYVQSWWMHGYWYFTLMQMEDYGWNVAALLREMSKLTINMVSNPAYNPWLVAEYRTPVTQTGGISWFSTIASMLLQYSAGTAPGQRSGTAFVDDVYARIHLGNSTRWGAASGGFTHDTFPGTTARSWLVTNTPTPATNAKFYLEERTASAGGGGRKITGKVTMIGKAND